MFDVFLSHNSQDKGASAGHDEAVHAWPSWLWEPADEGLLAIDAGRGFTCEERHRLLNEETCPETDFRR